MKGGQYPNEQYLEKFESERKKYKEILTQKQREIIYYKQMLKDNNINYERPEKDQRDNQEMIVEEDEISFNKDNGPEETEVNSGFPMHFNSKSTK
jgi:Skp family chaperone for outer membrane proteins